jgi:exosortase B
VSIAPSLTGFPSSAKANPSMVWIVALVGYALMYIPSYWTAAHGLWQTDDQAHGPIVLAVVVWLFWTHRQAIVDTPAASAPWLGWPLFVFGLLAYIAGRASDISSMELGSQFFVTAGLFLLLKGAAGWRAAWFPILYLIFMTPLPASLVDAMTGPLKGWISTIVVELLYQAGYPIGQSGVIISIGRYQMLVADACSGLHSMFSLSALGTLFIYIMRRPSRTHNVIMLMAILPIAFISNIVRVIVLVLITFYLGDEAGQGFLHGTAGMVLMFVALCSLFLVDTLLALATSRKARTGTEA